MPGMSPVKASKGDADAESAHQKDEKHVVVFEAPSSPTLVATSPYQMTLQWKQPALKSEADSTRIKGLALKYALMLKLVSLTAFCEYTDVPCVMYALSKVLTGSALVPGDG